MIEVKNLTKRYGKTTAVDNLSFTVKSGCIYGLLGPNGAGKSTTMNIMTGCLAATQGQVIINSHDIFEEPVAAKKCIGYLPEVPPLYREMTPYEFLMFVGTARGLKKNDAKNDIERISLVTGIKDNLHRLIKNLSKGYCQRVGIASALMGDPEVIILDEPTVGLDPVQIVEIRDMIRSLGKNRTVIISSHILSEISAVCDEILIMSNGKLLANDTAENLSAMLSPGHTVVIQARGAADKIKDILADIDGVAAVEITAADEDGTVTAALRSEKDTDIREQVFYAMKDACCPLLSMHLREDSLEDIFMRLVTADCKQKKEAGI